MLWPTLLPLRRGNCSFKWFEGIAGILTPAYLPTNPAKFLGWSDSLAHTFFNLAES